jgi:hypothetical protein
VDLVRGRHYALRPDPPFAWYLTWKNAAEM